MLESNSDPILGRAIHRSLDREKVSIPKHTTIHSFFVFLLTQRKLSLKLISCEMVQNLSESLILTEPTSCETDQKFSIHRAFSWDVWFLFSKTTQFFPTASYRLYNSRLFSGMNILLMLLRLFPLVSTMKVRGWKVFISIKYISMHETSSFCNLCAAMTNAMTSFCANRLFSSLRTDPDNAGVSIRTQFRFSTR